VVGPAANGPRWSNQLPVTQNSHVVGMLTREDVISFSADTARIWRNDRGRLQAQRHPLQSNSTGLTTGEEGNRGYCLDNDEGIGSDCRGV